MRWAPGYDGLYLVHRDGRVFNRNGREMVANVDRYGYLRVRLSRDGKQRHMKVHRLVCEAWHGPCPEGRECGHLNSVKTDNRPENLAWITRSENMQHNVARGACGGGVSGERHHWAKLSDEQVAELRSRARAGESGRSLAREFGIQSMQASRIIRGVSRATK